MFSSYTGVAASGEDECAQLGSVFPELADRLHPLSLSLVLKAERSDGGTVWLPASVTTDHAAPGQQLVEGG